MNNWTPEEDEILRTNYKVGNTGKVKQAIFNKTGKVRTIPAIRCRATFIGVSATAVERRHWTEKEDESLADCYGNLSTSTLCRKFGRSYRAITKRASFLGISRIDRYDCYTQTEVCQMLGIGEKKFHYYEKIGLKTRKLNTNVTVVDKENLKDFLIANAFDISGRNIQFFEIVQVLTDTLLKY